MINRLKNGRVGDEIIQTDGRQEYLINIDLLSHNRVKILFSELCRAKFLNNFFGRRGNIYFDIIDHILEIF